jgi:hypothetical protein
VRRRARRTWDHGDCGDAQFRRVVERWLPDDGGRRLDAGITEDVRSRGPGDVGVTHAPQEDGLAEDGVGARSLASERLAQRIVGRFSLTDRVGSAVARPAQDAQLVGHLSAEPPDGRHH